MTVRRRRRPAYDDIGGARTNGVCVRWYAPRIGPGAGCHVQCMHKRVALTCTGTYAANGL